MTSNRSFTKALTFPFRHVGEIVGLYGGPAGEFAERMVGHALKFSGRRNEAIFNHIDHVSSRRYEHKKASTNSEWIKTEALTVTTSFGRSVPIAANVIASCAAFIGAIAGASVVYGSVLALSAIGYAASTPLVAAAGAVELGKRCIHVANHALPLAARKHTPSADSLAQ